MADIENDFVQRHKAPAAERQRRPLLPLVYARHGRELMGCKSPVFESITVVRWGKSTSRRQGRLREEGSGGSLSAKL